MTDPAQRPILGNIDLVDGAHLIGWAWKPDDGGALRITVNGMPARVLESGIARPDVERAGAPLASGFIAEIPPEVLSASERTLRVTIGFDASARERLELTVHAPPRPSTRRVIGHLDYVDSHYVHGWIAAGKEPGMPIVTVDGRVAEIFRLRLPRNDVAQAGYFPKCGFMATLPEGAPEGHTFEVKLFDLFDRLVPVTTSTFAAADIRRGKRAAVVCWDVAHNPAGRARVLFDVLARRYEIVDLIGPMHPRFGRAVWAPVRESRLPIRTAPASNLAELDSFATSLPRNYDLVWICKPRFPSLLLADAISTSRTQIILDIDDHELSFFPPAAGAPSVEEIAKELTHAPFDGATTRYIDRRLSSIRTRTVSNPALGGLYGGAIIRHARDERLFQPLSDSARAAARTRAGISHGDFLLVFVGTPRRHKGIHRLAELVQHPSLKARNVRLMVVGADDEFRTFVSDRGLQSVACSGPVSFEELPGMLQISDGVVLLQDPASPISRYQIPAKISDALSVGVPVLVSDVPPVHDLRDTPGVFLTSPDRALEDLVTFVDRRHDRAQIRSSFMRSFSTAAATEQFDRLVSETPESDWKKNREGLHAIVAEVRGMAPAARRAARPPERSSDAVDVVLLWKQNDLQYYGRRVDSIISALERSRRVARVLCIEAPTPVRELARQMSLSHADPGDLRVRALNVLGGHWKTRDRAKVAYRTFLYQDEGPARLGLQLRHRGEYARVLSEWLDECGISHRAPILWTFPTNYDFYEVLPLRDWGFVVADYIDDQTQFTSNRETHRKIIENYLAIARRADSIIFSNEPNLERARSRWLDEPAEKIRIVPNSVDLRAIDDALSDAGHSPAHDQVVIGYVGNLQHRIDFGLLLRVGQLCTERGWTLELVGPGLPEDVASKLGAMSSVRLRGPLPFAAAIRAMSTFTVGLLPHQNSGLTESMHPLKVYQYRACGVPIVATHVQNLPDLDGILVCRDHDEFLNAIPRAVRLPRTRHRPSACEWDRLIESTLDAAFDRSVGRAGRVDPEPPSARASFTAAP